MSAHAYRTTRKPGRSDATRERIKGAVRELLAEGTFHTSTVEHVADRAGISRATLYQHFRSRLELVDAICETFDANPALLELRQIVELPDAEAAIDPAAQNLVDRQRNDRRSELERLTGNLHRTKRLRDRTTARALNLLLVLTSYETFRELREAGLSDRQLTATLQQAAHDLLLGGR